MKPVALISMPTLSARFPSFQLALLKPTLERAGIPVEVFSLFLNFGAAVGWQTNEAIAEVWPSMLGEWIWSRAAFSDEASGDDAEYFRLYDNVFQTICRRGRCTTDRLREIRDRDTLVFIDHCVESVDWSRFGLIGFSVVFQQMVGSLALARALKRRFPAIPIVFGGASIEDDIADEILRQCPQVDFMHCGDGEISFPEMIRRLDRGESLHGLRGIMWRNEDQVEYAGRAPNFLNMDETPVPDFDEYFRARSRSGYENWEEACDPMLPIETARGCWWGEKHHCSFCGMNRSGMEFRAKDPAQAIGQLETLSRRYGVFHFNAIDNIMVPEYAEKLFRRLAEAHTDLHIHYEIRPSVSRTQLGRMRKGGLHSVQPGVESFATNLLKSMRKMSTGMRNVELIKWCTYYGIHATYNILLGFPGETEEDYRVQASLVPKIVHLQPPYGIVKARADRGSPMFTEPQAQSVTNLRPAACYRYIFPRRFNLARVSYYFDHDMAGAVDEKHYSELLSRVADWQARWEEKQFPVLRYRKAFTSIVIEDGRQAPWRRYSFRDRQASLYEYCGDARTERDIAAAFGADDWVRQALDDFVAADLTLFLDGRYLSLALPENPHFDAPTGPLSGAAGLRDRPEDSAPLVALTVPSMP